MRFCTKGDLLSVSGHNTITSEQRTSTMKEFVVFSLALTAASALGVEHQPRDGGVPHSPRSRQVEAMACGSSNVLNFGEYAVLESPNYPRRYKNNVDCSWELVFPAGAEVFYSCETFRVKRGDYFTIGDESFYGNYFWGFGSFEVDLLDTQTSLQINFSSNRRRRSKGFR